MPDYNTIDATRLMVNKWHAIASIKALYNDHENTRRRHVVLHDHLWRKR